MGLDEMPPTLRGRFSTDGKRTQKGAKKEPKKAPLFYIYIAWKGLFLSGLRDGAGFRKSILLKGGGEGSGKNDGH